VLERGGRQREGGVEGVGRHRPTIGHEIMLARLGLQ
jgi:hypothetical protein